MSIGRRLGTAFLVTTLLTLCIGIAGLRLGQAIHDTTERVAARVARVHLAERGVKLTNDNSRRAFHLFLLRGQQFDKEAAVQWQTSREITALHQELERTLDSEQERVLFATISGAREKYLLRRSAAEKLLQDGDREAAQALFEDDVLPQLEAYMAAWDDLLGFEVQGMNDAVEDASRVYARTKGLMFALIAVVVLLGLSVSVVVTRQVVRPILAVADAASRLQAGEFEVQVQVVSDDEVGVLARAFNAMGEAVRYRQERLEREMSVARHIQTAILPRSFDVPRMKVAAAMRPATEIGGDYYDVLPVSDGCFIGIGDVAGHGLDAGLVMLMLQAGVAALVRDDPDTSPRRIISSVNRLIYENLNDRLKATGHATMVVLRVRQDGSVAFAGAHEELLIWRTKTRHCETLDTPGTWVGAASEIADVTTDSFAQLMPGDLLVLYTDGMVETRNAAGVPFGIEGLIRELELASDEPVDRIRDQLLAAIDRHASHFEDDVSVVVLRYTGTES
jgi:serine phosphatase RsbU (regulator of sigma subunit)